jgi:hypothetical protein
MNFIFSLKLIAESFVHLSKLTIQLLDPTDQIEDDGSAREVDAEVTSKSLHTSKTNDCAMRKKRLSRFAFERFNQAVPGQTRDQRAPRARRLCHHVER